MQVKKKPQRGRIIALIVIIAAAALAVVVLRYRIASGKTIRQGQVFHPVSVESLKRNEVSMFLSYEGSVQGDPQNSIYSQVAGVFDHNVVKEGDYVTVNQPVAFINRNIIGQSYQLAPVLATSSGVVIHLYFLDRGMPVLTTSPVADVANINKLKVVLNVGQADMMKLSAGQKAVIFPESGSNNSVNAYVDEVTPFIDLTTQTGQVTIKALNPGNRLRIGMTANVEVFMAVSNIIMVPDLAVVNGESETDVFIVQNDNSVKKVPVVSGYNKDSMAEIESPDIHEGDLVVTAGSDKLNDGSLVHFNPGVRGQLADPGSNNTRTKE